MDGRPSRVAQPAFRGATTSGGAAAAHSQQIAAVPVTHAAPQQRIAHQQHTAARTGSNRKAKSAKRFIVPIAIGVTAFILGLSSMFLLSRVQGVGTHIDTSKYQAVFFTNGQVYFGKLHQLKNNRVKLTEVYYLQTQTSEVGDSENPQTAAADQGNIQLIKLGDEVHGPEDAMIISEDQMLFFENLKPEGKVAQSIEKYKSSKK